MPYSRDEAIEKRKANRAAVSLPYSQTNRKSRKAGWTPSIWNALAFWKSGGASSQEEEERDALPGGANGHEASGSGSSGSTDKLNGGMIGFGDVEDSDANTSMSSTLSEAQVASVLSQQSPRHVRFNLPSHDQERFNARQLQPLHPSRSQPETPIKQSPQNSYVAPIPPSSPLHRNSSPHKDPLSQVSDYIDHVILPRDGKANYVEALGLTTLIQEGTYKAQVEAQMQYNTPQRSSPFLISASGSASSSVSPSPPPIRPTFMRPDTDIAAVVAASFAPSNSPPSSSFPSPSSPSTSTSTSGRTLARNPNGSLYYQGGGSSRSRYRSPSFGTPPSKKRVAFPRGFGDGQKESPKMNGIVNGSPDMSSPSDGKRRRVGEEKDASTAQASGSNSAMPNGTTLPTPNARSNGPPPSTLRFSTLPSTSRFMASTPARPSPLRQSMRADSSSPSTASPGSENGASPRITNGDGDSPSRSRASEKASEIMAGIINDATPKKDPMPDVRNPYQSPSRSPTKRTRKPVAKAPRPPPRPARKTTAPTPQSSEPKKLSALETIQRTAPQAGSKRSHTGMPPPTPPPANGTRTRSGASQAGTSAQKPLVIEIDDDEEDDEEEQAKRPPTKKQRQDNERQREGKEKVSQKERQKQTSIDVDDVDMDTPASVEKVERPSEVIEPDQQQQQETKRPVLPSPFSGKKGPTARFQSVPKEPSPLRQSFQPDAPPSPPKESTSTTSFASPPSSSPFGQAFALSPTSSPFGWTSTTSPTTPAPAPEPSKSTPAQAPTAPAPAPSTSTSTSTPPSAATAQPASATSTDWLAVARKQVTEAPAHTLPTFAFVVTSTFTIDEYEAQRKAALAVPMSELPRFDFSTPPTTVPPPKSEVKAFDWDGAGMKRTVTTSGWKCGLCGLANPEKAVECTICGASKV